MSALQQPPNISHPYFSTLDSRQRQPNEEPALENLDSTGESAAKQMGMAPLDIAASVRSSKRQIHYSNTPNILYVSLFVQM